MSRHDFRDIKTLYERVFINNEKILTKQEYKLLKDFINSERVQKYFVKLLDEDHLHMSGAPKKTRALTDDILNLNWQDRHKFLPVLKYLKTGLANNKEIWEDVIFWYNFPVKHKKDDNLELHAYDSGTGNNNTYGLILCIDSEIVESENSDYTEIYYAHEFDWAKILRAKKGTKQEWYIGIIDNKIVEISNFDFTKREIFSDSNPCIASKETWKGILYFDGTKVKELTSFDFLSIWKEKVINGLTMRICKRDTWIEFLYKMGDEWKQTEFNIKKEHLDEKGINIITTKNNTEEIITFSQDGIRIIGETNYKHIKWLTGNDSLEAVWMKDEKKQYIWMKKSWEIGFSELCFLDIKEFNSRGFANAKKDTWWGVIKKENDEIKEVSNFDFLDPVDVSEYGDFILKKESGQWIIKYSKEGISELTNFEYIYIGESNTKGFSLAQKENGYGLLKKLKGEFNEVSDFWFQWNALEQILEKEYGIYNLCSTKDSDVLVNFTTQGISKVLDFTPEEIVWWNDSNQLFYIKKIGSGYAVAKQYWKEIKILSDYEYISLPNNLSGNELSICTKKSGCGYIRITENEFMELSAKFDLDGDESSQIHSKWKYIVKKKEGWYGMVVYDGKTLQDASSFDFDSSWDTESEEEQEITRGGKKCIIRNTENGVEVVTDLSEYEEIDTTFEEEETSIAVKNGMQWVVWREEWKITDLTKFIYDEIGEFDDIGLSISVKDEKTGLLIKDEKEIKEVFIESLSKEDAWLQSDWESSFVFRSLEIRRHESYTKWDSAIVVWETAQKDFAIFRYFDSELHSLTQKRFKSISNADINGVYVCQNTQDVVSVFCIWKNWDFLNMLEGKDQYQNIEPLVWDIYKWKWENGKYALLKKWDDTIQRETEFIFDEVEDSAPYIKGVKDESFGYLKYDDTGIKEISGFHYTGLYSPKGWEVEIVSAGDKNSIVYFDGTKVLDLFIWDVKSIDLTSIKEDINSDQKGLHIYENNIWGYGVLEFSVNNKVWILTEVVDAKYKDWELHVDEKWVYVWGGFFKSKNYIYTPNKFGR